MAWGPVVADPRGKRSVEGGTGEESQETLKARWGTVRVVVTEFATKNREDKEGGNHTRGPWAPVQSLWTQVPPGNSRQE
ncbi:hypothetical protein NDU88_002359 [Pleurodeles waltl]|uniref:Uncharacterized protein n=1 Tax=Pleurodeles waltl TaxID=8319 RepID=A0AAV7WQ23_PLEWA|nr:hypothetical protein NDU88_002359 [Pleurodeles waltl]